MSELKPIKQWAYPVKLAGTSADFEPAMYFEGLGRSLGGSYPMGQTGLFHPAVHFDFGSAAFVDHGEVYAMADGQVVAYRMDAEPLTTRYGPDSDLTTYSSSFVLIKHKLQLPPKPPAPAAAGSATPAPAASTEQPASITLYSLYMHLLDAKNYNNPPNPSSKLPLPPYLPIKYKVKAGVEHYAKGLNIRDKPNTGNILGFIPLNGKVQKGDLWVDPRNPHTPQKWAKFVSSETLVIQASPMPEGKTPSTHGWVFTGDIDANSRVKTKKPDDSAPNPRRADLTAPKVTYVYDTDKPTQTIIANIPAGAIVELGAKSKVARSGLYEIKSVENLQNFPPPPTDATGKLIGWIDMGDLEPMPFTPPTGVTLVNPPVDVKAGQMIGHPGRYQNHNNTTMQIQLHVELFTPDDLPAFITKGKAWAQDPNVKASDKTLLKVAAGKKLIAAQLDNAGKLKVPVTTPPKTSDAGVALHSDIVLPLSALNALPANQRMTLPESTAPNAKQIHWWFLDNIGGQAGGTKVKGWLCENDVTRICPWEWDSFVTLEDDTTDEKLLAYQLKLLNKLLPQEESKYSSIVSEAQSWPVMKQLMQIIKANQVEGVTITDSLTTTQLKDATKAYWCAQKIASIALKTKTEWKKDTASWNALDTLMCDKLDHPNEFWKKEKERTERLSFWSEMSSVVGGAEDIVQPT